MSRRGGCFAAVVVLLLLAGAVWYFRADVLRLARGGGAEPTEVSPEAAAMAEDKLERLEEGDTVRLSGVEISSMVRYRYQDRLPGGMETPTVAVAGDAVIFRGRLPTDRLPPAPELDRVRAFLPDTTDVEVSGHLRVVEPGRSAFEIEQLTVEGFPIPSHFYPTILERLGLGSEPGLPPHAFAFPLPGGVREVRAEGGTLLLIP